MRKSVIKADWRRAVHSIAVGPTLSHLHPNTIEGGIADLHGKHNHWFRQHNVLGIGVGRGLRGGVLQTRSIQVFVRRKVPEKMLEREDAPPIPKFINGRPLGFQGRLPVDVRAIGEPHLQSLFVVDRPARPGYNIGDESGASGTIACAVRDRESGQVLGLSCAHVLASEGLDAGAAVFVPSLAEAESMGVAGTAKIGTLVRVASIGFGPNDAATNVDAATFAPTDPNNFTATMALTGKKPRGIRSSVSEALPVQKIGSITEQTEGKVLSQDAIVKALVPDAAGVKREALFVDQIGVTPFAEEGDSGSLVMDQAGNAVGLHFWGAPGLSVCQPIQRVFDALECDIV